LQYGFAEQVNLVRKPDDWTVITVVAESDATEKVITAATESGAAKQGQTVHNWRLQQSQVRQRKHGVDMTEGTDRA
jgi:3-keto-L-gulonate-6-phosphate decarboxylase